MHEGGHGSIDARHKLSAGMAAPEGRDVVVNKKKQTMESPENTAADRTATTAAPAYSTELVEDWDRLAAMEAEWDALAADAVEPNLSSESWMLLPSLRRLVQGKTVKVLLIRAANPAAPQDPGPLCGVFALEVRESFHGLPIRTVRAWNHVYALFSAPLLRAGCAVECIEAILHWAAHYGRRPCFIEFPEWRADSEAFRALSEVLRVARRGAHAFEVTTRAVFRPRRDAERYLEGIGTAKHRHEMRRQARRLAELGVVSFEELPRDADPAPWLEEFMALEASGWKGRGSTAFGSDPQHRGWLLEVGQAAAARGRLMLLALRLDGRPIAMKLNFVTASGGYAFKIAFDEKFSKYSPGTLLELENIRRLHANPEIQWMDSLAVPDHSLKNRVWPDRAAIVSTVVAAGGAVSQLLLSLVPLMRWTKRILRRDS